MKRRPATTLCWHRGSCSYLGHCSLNLTMPAPTLRDGIAKHCRHRLSVMVLRRQGFTLFVDRGAAATLVMTGDKGAANVEGLVALLNRSTKMMLRIRCNLLLYPLHPLYCGYLYVQCTFHNSSSPHVCHILLHVVPNTSEHFFLFAT